MAHVARATEICEGHGKHIILMGQTEGKCNREDNGFKMITFPCCYVDILVRVVRPSPALLGIDEYN